MKFRLQISAARFNPGSIGLKIPRWQERVAGLRRNLRHVTPYVAPSRESSDPYKPWLTDARTMRLVENTAGLVAHPNDDTWPQWAVELARFAVPRGMFGIVKSFDQFLGIMGLEAAELPTESSNWGVPFSGFTTTGIGAVTWHFRLSEYYGTLPPLLNAVNSQALPGVPHPDFPSTNDFWFPAHSPSANNFHLPVPGGNVLRVILIVGPMSYRPQAAARLSGWLSTYLSPENRHAIRSTW